MMVLSVFQGLIQQPGHVVHAQNNVREIQSGDSQTTIRQDGCDLFINKTQDGPYHGSQLTWIYSGIHLVPSRTPLVASTLRRLFTSAIINTIQIIHVWPSTQPKTTDRVMVATPRLDGKVTYDRGILTGVYDSWRRAYPGYNPSLIVTLPDNPVYEKYDGTSYQLIAQATVEWNSRLK